MKVALALVMTSLCLAGCGTSVNTLSVEQGEYEISADSPGGMYGSFIGLSPSEEKLTARAKELCPKGYRKVGEDNDHGIFAIRYLRWDILCAEASAS